MAFLTKIKLQQSKITHKSYIKKIEQITAKASIGMTVTLGAGINPDFDIHDQTKISLHKVPVKSLEHASEVVTKFIDAEGIGGGQWYAADAGWVYQNGKKIARINYNGSIDNEVKAAAETNQYLVYVMSEEDGKEAGSTVPIPYALRLSTKTNKKIALTPWSGDDTPLKATLASLAKALKATGLVDPSTTDKDLEIDGDEKEIGVWYKGVYRFTLIKE